MSYEQQTIEDLKEVYKGEEWFKKANDKMIYTAWKQRSEDSCSTWLTFNKSYGQDMGFERYLRIQIAIASLEDGSKEIPQLKERIQELEMELKDAYSEQFESTKDSLSEIPTSFDNDDEETVLLADVNDALNASHLGSVSGPRDLSLSFVYSTLNPGIVETVRFLRSYGFKTTDSGDGVEPDWECDIGIPYVHMEVEPRMMHREARRLRKVLRLRGVEVEAPNEDGTNPNIQTSYDPVTNIAVLSLYNVKL